MRLQKNPARALLQMNLGHYPDDALSHSALADFLVATGDLETARLHFEHALGLGAEFDIEARLAAAENP